MISTYHTESERLTARAEFASWQRRLIALPALETSKTPDDLINVTGSLLARFVLGIRENVPEAVEKLFSYSYMEMFWFPCAERAFRVNVVGGGEEAFLGAYSEWERVVNGLPPETIEEFRKEARKKVWLWGNKE